MANRYRKKATWGVALKRSLVKALPVVVSATASAIAVVIGNLFKSK